MWAMGAAVLAGVGAIEQNGGVLGPILIIVTLLVVVPVGVIVTGAVVAWAMGSFLTDDAAARYEGTEHVELGR
jgi:hypothetical protein